MKAGEWKRLPDGRPDLSLMVEMQSGVLGKGVALQLHYISDENQMMEVAAKRAVPHILQLALSPDQARDIAAALVQTANEVTLKSAKPTGPAN